MKVTFLGTGTSAGVPVLGCDCAVCHSADPRDKRFRSAAMIESQTTRLLIDCGPDIRMSLLRVPFRKLDGVQSVTVNFLSQKLTLEAEDAQLRRYPRMKVSDDASLFVIAS